MSKINVLLKCKKNWSSICSAENSWNFLPDLLSELGWSTKYGEVPKAPKLIRGFEGEAHQWNQGIKPLVGWEDFVPRSWNTYEQ